MMAAQFDPSIISQIPDFAPDPIESKAKAYKLADLIDQEQLGALKTYQAKREQADMDKARQVLSKSDISTPEGLMKASQSLAKEGLTQPAMDLLKESQNQRQTNLQLDEGKLRVLQLSTDVIGPAALQIKQTLMTKGLPMAQAQYTQMVAQVMPQIPQELRSRIPAQPPQDPQQFMQLLDGAINGSQQARQVIAQQLATRKEETAEKSESERERHDLATETNAAKRTSEAGGFTNEMGSLMAAMAERGVSLPTGFRSKAQQAQLYKGLLDRNPGKSPDEIAEMVAKGQIEFGAQKKETQTAAGVAGKVEVAENELNEFVPLVREASAKVPRGRFVPINKLLQTGEAAISDPNLKALKIRINSVLNAYDMLAARGGTDKDKRAEVRSLIMSADSPEALEAGLKSFELEAAAAHRAAVKATKVPELKDSSPTGGGWKIEPVQ